MKKTKKQITEPYQGNVWEPETLKTDPAQFDLNAKINECGVVVNPVAFPVTPELKIKLARINNRYFAGYEWETRRGQFSGAISPVSAPLTPDWTPRFEWEQQYHGSLKGFGSPIEAALATIKDLAKHTKSRTLTMPEDLRARVASQLDRVFHARASDGDQYLLFA